MQEGRQLPERKGGRKTVVDTDQKNANGLASSSVSLSSFSLWILFLSLSISLRKVAVNKGLTSE